MTRSERTGVQAPPIATPRASVLAPEPAIPHGGDGLSNLDIQRALREHGADSLRSRTPQRPRLGDPVPRASLEIGSPSDPLEREADQAAEQVSSGGPVAGSPGLHAARGIVRRTCAACEAGTPCSECRDRVARSDAADGAADLATSTLASSPGAPLHPETRAYFESRLAADFGAVRVHTDTAAAASARAVSAQAYTLGTDIVFAAGKYAPDTEAGQKLLAHELVHVAQQAGGAPRAVRRQGDTGGQASDAGVGGAPPQNTPDTGDAGVPQPAAGEPKSITIGDLTLTESADDIRNALEAQVIDFGPRMLDYYDQAFAKKLADDEYALSPAYLSDINGPERAEFEEKQKALVAFEKRVAAIFFKAIASLKTFRTDFEKRFQDGLVAFANQTLDDNEQETKREAVRYGLTQQDFEMQDDEFGPMTYTVYGLSNAGAGAVKGLAAAANLLLVRRQKLNALYAELRDLVYTDPETGFTTFDPGYDAKRAEITAAEQQYDDIQTVLASQYPLLASVSTRDQGTGELEKLATGPAQDMAQVIGAHVAKNLENIKTVRDGLKDGSVNVWRQSKLVGLATAAIAQTQLERALVRWRVEDEQPGALESIALLVFNLLALALAAPTAGISLAVAAGVNAAVAVEHIKEYMLQSALSGTAFDKAKAISREEPSLFWLAVEIVGVFVDVGMAAAQIVKAFKVLAPLVKAAETAKEGEQALEALEAARSAAKATGGAELAEKVAAQIEQLRQGEALALKAAKATPEEIKALEAATQAAEAETKAGALGEQAVKNLTGGEMKLSGAGHVFTCSSPCTLLRERYADVFAKDPQLLAEMTELEARAQKAAEASKAGAKDAQQLADAVKRDAAALEQKIVKTHPEAVAPAVAEEKEAVQATRLAEEEGRVTTGRLQKSIPELKAGRPDKARPPEGVVGNKAQEELWADYCDYYNDRVTALEKGTPGVEKPLPWDRYSEFRGKFLRGTQYQEAVEQTLEKEAVKAAQGEGMFKNMREPEVLGNVGVGGKEAKLSAPGTIDPRTTKFVDQLVIDKSTIQSGNPMVEVLSNKSRVFPTKLTGGAQGEIERIVQADVFEALDKYGGEITLRRPQGTLKSLYGQTVKVSKVTLVYDSSLATDPAVRSAIQRVAARNGIAVVFLP